jgi:tripeptidyl-peptidase-1
MQRPGHCIELVMRLSVISAALSAHAVQSFALPTGHIDHVVHEKRNDLQRKWIQGDVLELDYVFPARIGLKQNNLELGALYLHEV